MKGFQMKVDRMVIDKKVEKFLKTLEMDIIQLLFRQNWARHVDICKKKLSIEYDKCWEFYEKQIIGCWRLCWRSLLWDPSEEGCLAEKQLNILFFAQHIFWIRFFSNFTLYLYKIRDLEIFGGTYVFLMISPWEFFFHTCIIILINENIFRGETYLHKFADVLYIN